MTAFSRPIITLIASFASLMAVTAANAFPAIAPSTRAASSNFVKVHDRYDRDDRRYHGRHYRHGRNVVHAPFTRVESGRRTVVDAPFAHVYSDRHGRTHVRAPFVNLWD